MRPCLPILALALLASTPAGAATAAQTDPGAPLRANEDGSWTITEEIAEAPVPLALTTDGLLLAHNDPENIPEAERERLRDAEIDALVKRAFEEAIDLTRNPGDPD